MRRLLIVGWTSLLLLLLYYFGLPCRESNNITRYVWPSPGEPLSTIIFSIRPVASSILNSRQACAVESAARHHLGAKVNVFVFSSAPLVNSFPLNRSLSNVNLIRVGYDEVFAGTPLERWYQAETKRKGRHLTRYITDSVRFLLVWKFGGIYLDTDVITLKSLQHFKNFVIKDGDPSTTSAFGFQKNHTFLSLYLDFLGNTYNRNSYDRNATGTTLTNYCEVKTDYCKIHLLPSSALFPVSGDRWRDYFSASKLPYMLRRMEGSHAIHIDDSQSRGVKVPLGSGTALEEAMRSNCPLVYHQLAKSSGYV